MPRPRGGDWLEDEIKSLKFSGVDVIISLLESEEIAELDIIDEEKYCRAAEIAYLSFPIRDRKVPASKPETLEFAQNLSNSLKKGKNVVIHCRQGVGRAALIAACVMTVNGFSSDEAFAQIRRARTCEVPDTAEQKDWVKDFAADI